LAIVQLEPELHAVYIPWDVPRVMVFVECQLGQKHLCRRIGVNAVHRHVGEWYQQQKQQQYRVGADQKCPESAVSWRRPSSASPRRSSLMLAPSMTISTACAGAQPRAALAFLTTRAADLR